MKNKRQSTWRKIINLSPLVDVLMIVIFWYIMMSNQTMEENREMAKNELEALKTGYETQIDVLEQEKAELTGKIDVLEREKAELEEKNAAQEQINEELNGKLQDLEAENDMLGSMVEKSVGYVYIRLFDGLNKNRMIEVNYETKLVDKFVFSSGDSSYLQQRLQNDITEYATQDEKERIAVIFIYEGSNAFYVDVTQIMNILYQLRTELDISVHTINMAD